MVLPGRVREGGEEGRGEGERVGGEGLGGCRGSQERGKREKEGSERSDRRVEVDPRSVALVGALRGPAGLEVMVESESEKKR